MNIEQKRKAVANCGLLIRETKDVTYAYRIWVTDTGKFRICMNVFREETNTVIGPAVVWGEYATAERALEEFHGLAQLEGMRHRDDDRVIWQP